MNFVSWTSVFSALTFTLMFFGVVCTLIPILPGPVLVFAGAALWTSQSGQHLPAGALIALGVIGAVAWGSDWVLTTLISKKAGASWKTIVGAVVGGLLGAALLGLPIPVLGSLVGAVAGAVLGVFLVELALKQDIEPAVKTSVAYLTGCFVSRLVEMALVAVMLVLFWITSGAVSA
jgi:uncharacterized protein YqgC (DUF456 family)